MANKVEEHIFSSKSDAVKSLGRRVIDNLVQANEVSGFSTILLSGGSTPGPLYGYLNAQYNDFDKTTVGLVDERFVNKFSEFSNEKLVTELIPKATKFIGMVFNPENYSENISEARIKNEIFKDKTDVVILGMGPDGHTASIFPGDPSSLHILESDDIDLYNTNAPSIPTRRVTCSKAMLLNAKHIYLLIFGKEKLDVLNDIEKGLPIHTFLKERNDIEIYYAEN